MMEYCDFIPDRAEFKSDTEIHNMGSVVYFMYAGNDLLYIGQSISFKRRVREHRRVFAEEAILIEDERLEHLKFKALYVPVEYLNGVEEFYIHKYLPPYNVKCMPQSLITAYHKVRLAKMELALAENDVKSIKYKIQRLSPQEQERLFRPKIMWEVDGVTKPATDWCDEYNIGYGQVLRRMDRGLTIKQALTFPRVPRWRTKHPMEYWKECGCL